MYIRKTITIISFLIPLTCTVISTLSNTANQATIKDQCCNLKHTKIHTLHNTTDKTIYVAVYLESKQIPYINGQGKLADNSIAVIAPKGQLKLHIPYRAGYISNTYPVIFYTHTKNELTPFIDTTALSINDQVWLYANKKTTWREDISFVDTHKKIKLYEQTPVEIAYEKERNSPTARIKPYKPYTFENSLKAPIHAAFYIKNQKVPFYNYRNNISTGDHILTIHGTTTETVSIPYVNNWTKNYYPTVHFSTSIADFPETLPTANNHSTYNLNQETWGYFTFSKGNAPSKITLTATHVTGIKAALANSSHYTIHNNTSKVLYFNLYYQSTDGTFKSMSILGDKQYLLNAVRGKHSKIFKVPAMPNMRLYVSTNQDLLPENAPDLSKNTQWYQFPSVANRLHGAIIITCDTKGNFFISREIDNLLDTATNSLTSLLASSTNTVLAAHKIISALIRGAWYKNISSSLLKTFNDHQIHYYEKACKHPAQNQEAYVTNSSDLSDEEKQYLAHHAMQETIDNDRPIRIALCSSGGGYRAIISTLGFFDGLQNINLMKHVTYNAGLSGSSLAMTGWQTSHEKKVETYKNALFSRASRFLNHELYDQSKEEMQHMLHQIIQNKALYPDTPFSIISPYGSILAQRTLMVSHPEKTCLTDIQKQSIYMPWNLHTAVIPQKDINKSSEGFYWVEFSPYHVNFVNYSGDARIPLWSFGRQFDHTQNKSINYSPPYSLPFCLGMWGSALSASIQEVTSDDGVQSQIIPLLQLLQASTHTTQSTQISIDSEKIKHLINLALNTEQYKQLEKYQIFTNGRLCPARIPSWVTSDEKFLTIVDAGVDFNLPLPPLLIPERNIDVVIMSDASGDLHTAGASELQKALRYAKNTYGFEYEIPGEKDNDLLAKNALSTEYVLSLLKKYNRSYLIFKPKNIIRPLAGKHKAPLLLYIPLLDCNSTIQLTETFPVHKLSYSKQEAEFLYKAMRDKIDIRIIEEIKRHTRRRY